MTSQPVDPGGPLVMEGIAGVAEDLAFQDAEPEFDLVESGRMRIEGLVAAESVPRPVARRCARCHGIDGPGGGRGAFPGLAEQRPVYIDNALRAFAGGQRDSGIMEPIAAAHSV